MIIICVVSSHLSSWSFFRPATENQYNMKTGMWLMNGLENQGPEEG